MMCGHKRLGELAKTANDTCGVGSQRSNRNLGQALSSLFKWTFLEGTVWSLKQKSKNNALVWPVLSWWSALRSRTESIGDFSPQTPSAFFSPPDLPVSILSFPPSLITYSDGIWVHSSVFNLTSKRHRLSEDQGHAL